MFDLIILFSRYLFLFYIVLFLWQAIVYIAYEQGGYLGSPSHAIAMQKGLIVWFHVTAFLILSYESGKFFFNMETLAVGVAGLAFLLLSMMLLDKFYYEGCPLIWTGMLFLLDMSLIMLQRLEPMLAVKQLIWMALGIAIMLFIPFILRMIPRFEVFEYVYIIVSYALILSTLLFGTSKYGSVNWLKIGPITFQPSEIVKFLFIFYLSSVFRKRVELKELLITGTLSAGIVLLLVLQKDLGSALIFFMTYMVMLYISTSNEILFFAGMGAASAAATLAYHLFSHVRVRVAAWRNPWADIDGGGYQILNSLFAITTWGLLGSGLTKGMPNTVPVVESDFIFAAICEEMGILFGMGIVCLYIMLFFRGILVVIRCQRRYYSLLAAGVITMFAFQAFLIIGGVIKLIPLTGVTLPFVSYGGSSVLVSIMMIGLLQWVNVYCEQHEAGYQKTIEQNAESAEWNEWDGDDFHE